MRIDDEENRFWIRTMPVLDKKDFDGLFMDKLRKELPHFIHYILNRPLKNNQKLGRFFLPDSVTHTVELERIRENSKSSLYLEIKGFIDDTFYNRRDTHELFFVVRDLISGIKNDRVGPKQVKLCLQKEFGWEPHKALRENSYTKEIRNSDYFSITRSDWYPGEETTPGLSDIFTV